MELTIDTEYKMKFPFSKHEGLRDDWFWYPGCILHEEVDEYYTSRTFTADAEGEVIYKILSLAEMPDKYKDRVIFKRWLVDPDGKKYNNGEVRMLTKDLFIRDINSYTPFKADYEIE